jgi:hypothetical protein
MYLEEVESPQRAGSSVEGAALTRVNSPPIVVGVVIG